MLEGSQQNATVMETWHALLPLASIELICLQKAVFNGRMQIELFSYHIKNIDCVSGMQTAPSIR